MDLNKRTTQTGLKLQEGLEEYHDEKIEQALENQKTEVALKKFLNIVSSVKSVYPHDYQEITEIIDVEQLNNPVFWTKVFLRFNEEIPVPEAIFRALPFDAQSNAFVQNIFLEQPGFSFFRVSKNIQEGMPRERVVQAWLGLVEIDKATYKNIPWKLFNAQEKRNLVLKVLQTNFFELDHDRGLFEDAILPDEWDEIAREQYQIKGITSDVDVGRLKELFTSSERNDLFKKNYLELSLPALRGLGADTRTITAWKEGKNNAFNLADGFKQFDQMIPEDQEWALSLLRDRAKNYDPGYKEFIETTLPATLRMMAPGAVEVTLRELESFLNTKFDLPPKDTSSIILKPILENQGPAGFRTISNLIEKVDCFESGDIELLNLIAPNRESAKVFRKIMIKTGARFQDFLSFYLETRSRRDENENLALGTIDSLDKEIYLEDFVDSRLPWTVQVFKQFEAAIADGVKIEDAICQIKKEVEGDIVAIREGELEEKEVSKNQLGLLSHVFPPALGVSRDSYANLVKRRQDRQTDVPFDLLQLQNQEIIFPRGKWQLKEGKTFETSPWNNISRVVSEINTKKIIVDNNTDSRNEKEIHLGPKKIVEFGSGLIDLLKRAETTDIQEALRNAYALYLSRGATKLPDVVMDHENAVRMTEWSQDTLQDMINLAVKAYFEDNPKEYTKKTAENSSRELTEKDQSNIADTIARLLIAKLPEEKKNDRIRAIFIGADLQCKDETISSLITIASQSPDKKVLTHAARAVIRDLVSTRVSTPEPSKIALLITQKIAGGDTQKMSKELSKWEFIEGADGGEQIKMSFAITKRKLHAVAGLNMGVCVAADEKLWNKPEFMNVVIFGEDNIARGGMHFEIIYVGKEKYLSLPGINPSQSLLREVKAEKITTAMLDYAKACAKKIDAKAVLIPTDPIIFSNREEIQKVIKSLSLQTFSLEKEHQFSYAPLAYAWQEAYVV